jgi:hypothetical protein
MTIRYTINPNLDILNEPMLPKCTTILLLTAILVQTIFGGLHDSVSICLGGGHEHEVTEVTEHCELECSHHSEWPIPIVKGEDVENCSCTHVDFSLITLISNKKDNDIVDLVKFTTLPTSPLLPYVNNYRASWHACFEYPPDKQHHLLVLRSTRLQV